MLCEKCGLLHEGLYGSGRFCSKKCAFSFGASQNRLERNRKTSESLKRAFQGNRPIKFCPHCQKEFLKPLGWKRRRCPSCPVRRYYVDTPFDELWNNEVRERRFFEEFGRHCWKCKNTHWLGELIPLELEHKNGIKTDNRKENCEVLCPNCHAQTPTYRWRNRTDRRKSGDVAQTESTGADPEAGGS